MNNNFEICVRGIIEKDGRILVCHHVKNNNKAGYYFFPGGHVEFGEQSENALLRELNEEVEISVQSLSFVGAVENIFKEENEIHHEINLVFEVAADSVEDKSKEDHIEFLFLDKKDFSKQNVLPLALRDAVVKWREDKNIFWISRNEVDKTV